MRFTYNESDMKTREKKNNLLKLLRARDHWVTSKELALAMNTTPRSIKYLVSEINKDHPDTIRSSTKGYRLSEDANLNDWDVLDSVPANYEERKHYLFKAILMDRQRLTVDELADQLCISETTLQNEFTRLRADLSEYNLNIRIRNNIVYIVGLEKDRQAALLSMISEEIKNSYFSLDKIQTIFTGVNLKEVREIIYEVLNRYSYYLDDYSLLNFLLHIALTIELRSNQPLLHNTGDHTADSLFRTIASPHVIRLVNDLYVKLKEKYNTNYDINDIYQASILMATRVRSNKEDKVRFSQIEDSFGPQISHLINEIITKVKQNYSINLQNDAFLVRFAFHLKNLVMRLQNRIPITNLQFDKIKDEYPLIYAISVYIAKIIQSETGLAMPEDEISYIALHIGILMEENDSAKKKLKCIIVAPNYNELGIKISKKLSMTFSESLLISDVVTQTPAKEDLKNVDLLISTNLIESHDIPTYIVEPLVSESNIKDLFTIIDEINNRKIKNAFKQQILYFFKDDLFFYDQPYHNAEEAIEALCAILKKRHYVEDGFKESIYEHERIASSSYGKIAISHPLNIDAKQSFIAVSLHPTPIRWGINDVNIVFMLSLRSDDRELFADIFQYITHIFKNDDAIRQVLQIDNFNDFVNYLVSKY